MSGVPLNNLDKLVAEKLAEYATQEGQAQTIGLVGIPECLTRLAPTTWPNYGGLIRDSMSPPEPPRPVKVYSTIKRTPAGATLPVRRREPKRPAGVSARQWKKIRRAAKDQTQAETPNLID